MLRLKLINVSLLEEWKYITVIHLYFSCERMSRNGKNVKKWKLLKFCIGILKPLWVPIGYVATLFNKWCRYWKNGSILQS